MTDQDQYPVFDTPEAPEAPPAEPAGPPDNRPAFERAAEGFDVGKHSYGGSDAPKVGDRHGHTNVPGAPEGEPVVHTHPAGLEPHVHGWPVE